MSDILLKLCVFIFALLAEIDHKEATLTVRGAFNNISCLKSDKISYFKFKVIFLKISFAMSTNNVGNSSVVTTFTW